MHVLIGLNVLKGKDYILVELKIPKGDRPLCQDICQKEVEGLKELVGLMKSCWANEPSERPAAKGRRLYVCYDCIDTYCSTDICFRNKLTKSMNKALTFMHRRLLKQKLPFQSAVKPLRGCSPGMRWELVMLSITSRKDFITSVCNIQYVYMYA